MSFEKFNKSRRSALGKEVNIAIYESGAKAHIGGELWKEIGEPEYLELLFDESRGIAAFQSSGDTNNSYSVKTYSQTATREIAPSAFIKKYNIKEGTYDAKVQDDMIIFEVDRKEVSK